MAAAMPKTSLGIWAFGSMVTRFVPGGYQPEYAGASTADKVRRAVGGLGDLVDDYERVWRRWDEVIGLRRLRCLHLNDSKTPLGSRRDRHELIGEGSLGPEPFRRIMRDPRFADVLKIIETPKGDEPGVQDRRMLRRLRGYARRRAR